MTQIEIIEALKDVRSTVSILIEQLTRMDVDIDHDDHNQSDQSDQIRSDQIRAHASNISSKEREFRAIAADNGIDLDLYDLKSIQRNITWFMDHRSTISAPQKYIARMVSEIKPSAGFRQKAAPAEVKEESNTCLGYEIPVLDEIVKYIDERAFALAKPYLPGSGTMFKDWQSVQGNLMKLRVVAAYLKKENIVD